MKRVDIYYVLKDESIYIKHKSQTSGTNIMSEEKKVSFFDALSKETFKQIKLNIKNKYIYLRTKEEEFYIHSYPKFKDEKYFLPIAKIIEKYEKFKRDKRMKIIRKGIVAIGTIGLGAAVAGAITISLANDEAITAFEEILPLEEESNNINLKNIKLLINDTLHQDDVEYNIKKSIEQPQIEQSISYQIDDFYINNKEIISEETDIEYKNRPFYKLSNTTNYDDVIKIAADIYGLDYETAKTIVQDKWEYITGPKMEVSMWMDSDKELDRIKDLKERGIINPDTTTVGIFLEIKNYTYDMNCNSYVERSNKTEEEKKQDLIDIAIYLYGIEDKRLLADILAAHSLETDYGKSDLSVYKNNQAAIRNGDLSYTSFRTIEIGAESAVRNLLKNYNRAFYDDSINNNAKVEYLIAKNYCEIPEKWARVVIERADKILETDELSNYINNNKSINL